MYIHEEGTFAMLPQNSVFFTDLIQFQARGARLLRTSGGGIPRA